MSVDARLNPGNGWSTSNAQFHADKSFATNMLFAVQVHRGEEKAVLNPPTSVASESVLGYTVSRELACFTESELTNMFGVPVTKLPGLKGKGQMMWLEDGERANCFLFHLKDLPAGVEKGCRICRVERSAKVCSTDHILLHTEQLIQSQGQSTFQYACGKHKDMRPDSMKTPLSYEHWIAKAIGVQEEREKKQAEKSAAEAPVLAPGAVLNVGILQEIAEIAVCFSPVNTRPNSMLRVVLWVFARSS